MQKIIIKNFGAIAYAEIEIKKVLVLIGEQASGKSTIAKLIYFFKTLRDDVFKSIYQDKLASNFAQYNNVVIPLREKFYDFFGLPDNLPNFDITFYYEADRYINLSLYTDYRNNRILSVNFSADFFSNSELTIGKIKQFLQERPTINNIDPFIYEQKKSEYTDRLIIELNNLFNYRQTDLLFIIAGRNVTVRYSEFFEQHFFASIEKILEKNTNIKSQLREQSIDEFLMSKFIERVLFIKDVLGIYGGFKDITSRYQSPENEEERIKKIIYLSEKKIFEILKGEYTIDGNHEEKIILSDKESIFLRHASSGQQESVRILQDILFVMLKQSKVFRIVEEPEAHLFPVAQKSLIELLALMVNQDDDNQLIITTHSPYMLTVFNNLLFAQRVVDKNPSAEAEVAELIPKEFWLKAKDFSAYSLGNASIHEEPEYCESIFNNQTGAIQQNYLDAVSEMLGGDFNYLYSLYAKTFRRK
jgi:predicted ATP-dependent endonuclease of OLD family